jgi:hypothetical protein
MDGASIVLAPPTAPAVSASRRFRSRLLSTGLRPEVRMLLGHYGIAFSAKRVAPRTSLGTLFFAAQLLDELWPLLLLLGLEQVRVVPGLIGPARR